MLTAPPSCPEQCSAHPGGPGNFLPRGITEAGKQAPGDVVSVSLPRTHFAAALHHILELTLDSPVSCHAVTLKNDRLNLIAILELNFSEQKRELSPFRMLQSG